jgi:hypothetical protein
MYRRYFVHTQGRTEMERVDCLTPDCSGVARSRGLCAACYGTARLRVASGLNTWTELEVAGLALPTVNNGQSAFTAAMQKQTEVEEAAHRRHKAAAREAHVAVQGKVVVPPTLEEFRQLAIKVANLPSAENMKLLIEMKERMPVSVDPPLPEPEPSILTPDATQLDAYEEQLKSPTDAPRRITEPCDSLPSLVPEGAAAYDLPAESRQMTLREKSLADARASAAGESVPEVDGGADDDGMSDEEYERIKQVVLKKAKIVPTFPADPEIRFTAPTQSTTPAQPVASTPPGPSASECAPDMDLAYDPALDAPNEQVINASTTVFVPVNPIT